MNYYYLVASLPSLRMEDPPPITLDLFRSLCGKHLSEADLTAMESALDEAGRTPAAHPFVAAWRNTCTQIRNAVARQRATRLQRDVTPCLRPHEGFDVWIESAVSEAFQRPNPLERQRALDRLLWERAGEISAGDPFAPAAVFAYAVRLQIAERWAAMNDDSGMQAVNARTAAGASS